MRIVYNLDKIVRDTPNILGMEFLHNVYHSKLHAVHNYDHCVYDLNTMDDNTNELHLIDNLLHKHIVALVPGYGVDILFYRDLNKSNHLHRTFYHRYIYNLERFLNDDKIKSKKINFTFMTIHNLMGFFEKQTLTNAFFWATSTQFKQLPWHIWYQWRCNNHSTHKQSDWHQKCQIHLEPNKQKKIYYY